MTHPYYALLLLLLTGFTASSQTPLPVQPPASSQPPASPRNAPGYLIRAGKLFDSEKGQFLADRIILVRGQFIDTVLRAADLTEASRNAYPTVIDLSAYTVTPGLMDCHTHLLYREIIYPSIPYSPSLDLSKELLLEGDAYRAIYGAAKAKGYLESGIVFVQDLGNSGSFGDIALRRAIREGLVPGPDMSCSGPGLATEGGQLPGLIYRHRDLVNDEYRIVKSVDDAIQAVRENINEGADVIKIYADNAPNITRMSVEEISAITKEAQRYRRKVTAHATNSASVWTAVMGGVNSIEHGYEMADSVMQLMAARHVDWVATLGDTVQDRRFRRLRFPDRDPVEQAKNIYRNFKRDSILFQRGIKNGLTVVCGSDDYVDMHIPFGEPTKHVLISYAEMGMPIPEVLKTATVNAIHHMGLRPTAGVLQKGELANIVAFGPHLDTDIHELLNTAFVMKRGVIYVSPPSPAPAATR